MAAFCVPRGIAPRASPEPPHPCHKQRRGSLYHIAQGSRGHGPGGDSGSWRSSETHAVPELPGCAMTCPGLWHRQLGWGCVTCSGQGPLGHSGMERGKGDGKGTEEGEGKGKGGKQVLLNRAPTWPGHGLHPCSGYRGRGLPPTRGQAQHQGLSVGTGLKTSRQPPWPGRRSPLTMLSVALSQGLRLRYFRWRSCKQTVQEAGFEAQRADLGFANQGRSSVPRDAPISPCTHMCVWAQ